MASAKKSWTLTIGQSVFVLCSLALIAPFGLKASPAAEPGDVTFTKDIAPILQRSCQTCHRPGGVAPMSLVSYDDVRPWARAIKQRTGIGPHAGVMPPWYIEKNIGIQQYKDDPSLSDGSSLYCWMPMFFSIYQGGITPACGPMPVRCLMALAHGRTSS